MGPEPPPGAEQDRATLAQLAQGGLHELLRVVQGSDVEELEVELQGTRLFFKRPALASQSQPASPGDGSVDGLPGGKIFVLAERVGFFHFPGEGGSAAPKLGDQVAVGQALGSIDSLNVPITVSAPCAGRLVEVMVEEGQPVEFGQPLFDLVPAAD